jgi:hypothetical protein
MGGGPDGSGVTCEAREDRIEELADAHMGSRAVTSAPESAPRWRFSMRAMLRRCTSRRLSNPSCSSTTFARCSATYGRVSRRSHLNGHFCSSRSRLSLLSDHAVPPHHRAGPEHGRGRESKEGPDRLRCPVAEPGPDAARDPDAADTAEVQVGEPRENPVDGTLPPHWPV